MNSWVKRLVDTRSRLAHLFKVSTVDVAETYVTKAILAEIRVIRNAKNLKLRSTWSPLVTHAANILLDYPLSLFLEQLRRANEFRGMSLDGSTMSGRIVHKVRQSSHDVVFDPPACSCGYFKSMGLPCRHYLCLAQGLFQHTIPACAFDYRWTAECAREGATFVVGASEARAANEEDSEFDVQESGARELAPRQHDHNSRMQEFKEVNRLFGERLRKWLDVCLSGKSIIDFPLPVAEGDDGDLRDTAPALDKRRKRIKSSEEVAAKRGQPIPVSKSPFVAQGVPETPLVANGKGRLRKSNKKQKVLPCDPCMIPAA